MKRIILAALLGLLMFQISPAADIAGQGNVVICSTMMREVYYEIAGFTTTQYKVADTAMVIDRLSWATRGLPIERRTTITVVASTEEYALPADFSSVRWVGAKPTATNLETGMKLIAGNAVGAHRDEEGIPQYYLVDVLKIHVEPTNTSGDSIIVHYSALSNVLAAITDTSNVDKTYQTLVVLRASEAILRGKQPAQGSVTRAILDDITARKMEEERRLGLQNESQMEILTK